MKNCIISLMVVIFWTGSVFAQPLERIVSSLPVFAASADVKTVEDGILTIGIFSDSSAVDQNILDVIDNLQAWDSDLVKGVIQYKKIEVISLNKDNITEFKGQIIWVLDASTASLEKLKIHTIDGVFTIGTQERKFEDNLFATLIYKNKSDDPNVERWRLIELISNCEISPLQFAKKVSTKKYFAGIKCD